MTFAYTVGTFGAVTTIMAALRQNYALDTRAEMYRAASAEYKIIVLEVGFSPLLLLFFFCYLKDK